MNLQESDRVAIVAPASQLRGTDVALLGQAVHLLESWGLRPVPLVDAGNHLYLAGKDDVRAAHINAAMSDDSIKAVFCLRGGYGSSRLLPLLDRRIAPSPKLLVGYSDVTALHGAVAKLWPDVRLIHGPNIATNQLLGSSADCELTRESLRDALFSPGRRLREPVTFLRAGTAEGPLVGGCLSLLVSLLGTPFEVSTESSILFIEDTGEPPYRVDRMLTHMRNARMLDGVAGVVFGEMHKCTDPYNDIRTVVMDVLADAACPVAFGLRSGHGPVNISLRLGRSARLDGAQSMFLGP